MLKVVFWSWMENELLAAKVQNRNLKNAWRTIDQHRSKRCNVTALDKNLKCSLFNDGLQYEKFFFFLQCSYSLCDYVT